MTSPWSGHAEVPSVDVEPDPAQCAASSPSRPWLTILLALVACGVFVLVQVVVVFVLLFLARAQNAALDVDAWIEEIPTNGFVLAICTLCGTLVVIPLMLLFSRLVSREGAIDYLALRRPTLKILSGWIVAGLAFVAICDGLSWLLGLDVVPPFMREAYRTAGPLPILWLALLVAAPVGEELLFRGFLFRGLIGTRLGLAGTALVTSLPWALLHFQYELKDILTIFLGGLLIAVARYMSQSTLVCMGMHSSWNLIATIEVALVTS